MKKKNRYLLLAAFLPVVFLLTALPLTAAEALRFCGPGTAAWGRVE